MCVCKQDGLRARADKTTRVCVLLCNLIGSRRNREGLQVHINISGLWEGGDER